MAEQSQQVSPYHEQNWPRTTIGAAPKPTDEALPSVLLSFQLLAFEYDRGVGYLGPRTMSISYQTWKSRFKSISGLFLDSENPRISAGRHLAGERAVITEVVTQEDVCALAKNIVENGLFPSEPLVAGVAEGKHLTTRYFATEGEPPAKRMSG